MASSLKSCALMSKTLAWTLLRGFHSTAACCKNRAARIRVGKGNRPSLMNKPCTHTTLHTARAGCRNTPVSRGNLAGEGGAADRTVEDVFLRRFMYGTFHNCLADELVIKRRGNILVVCMLLTQKLQPLKYYFLIGYTETLLSHFYKCPVKLEVQTVEKTVYKYL